jgi:hypothetical protein
MPSALLSVWGTSASDVYLVGSDAGDGLGPAVLHFDGASWTRLPTGQVGGLWWVFGFAGGPVYMGGDAGMILRYQNGVFTRMTVQATPNTGTVFGIWGAAPDDVWAVGGNLTGAGGAFAWRLQGDTWVAAAGFPVDTGREAIWKIYGRAKADAWMVGTNGTVVRWDGVSFTASTIGGESLFTVHADSNRYVAVGGFGTGRILENDGSGWHDASPSFAPPFIGVCLASQGAYAVGEDGGVYRRGASGWTVEKIGFNLDEWLHSVWIDPSGGVWAVGGQLLTPPLSNGIVLHLGTQIPEGL